MAFKTVSQGYRQIAKEEKISKNTVTRILSQSEVETLLQTYRSAVMGMIPDALKGLHALIRRQDRQAIIETLYGSKDFSEKKEIDIPPDEQNTYAFPKIAFFHKLGRWPTLEEAIEFDKTLVVEPLVKASARVNPSDWEL